MPYLPPFFSSKSWLVFTSGLIFFSYGLKYVFFLNKKFCTSVDIFSFDHVSSQSQTQLKGNPNTFHGCDYAIVLSI